MVAARLRGAGSDRAVGGAVRSSKPPASSYAPPMTSRVEVFVRSGHTIDLVLKDGQDRIFANGPTRGLGVPPMPLAFKHLTLRENAVIFANEVGYRLHGPMQTDSAV